MPSFSISTHLEGEEHFVATCAVEDAVDDERIAFEFIAILGRKL